MISKAVFVSEVDRVEWNAIVGRANVMLCGPLAAIDATLVKLQPNLRAPIHVWLGSSPPPSLHEMEGTLILKGAVACPTPYQDALLRALDAAGSRLQVITTTDRSLFDLVGRGAFLDVLYYRLNTLYLEVGQSS